MQRRLLRSAFALTVASVLTFFVPAALALRAADRDAQVVELQREAMDVAARILPGSSVDPGRLAAIEGADEGEGGGGANPDPEHRFALYASDGRRVAGEGPSAADAPTRTALAGATGTGRIGRERVVGVPLADGRALRAAEPASEADREVAADILGLGVAALVVLAVARLVARSLARRLARPLADLRATAVRLGAGDFTASAAVVGMPEIDDVAVALNLSAERIGSLLDRERHLTADTSHQLRTPLAGLRIAIEAELAAPREDRTAILHEALGALDRLDETAASLVQLAREERESHARADVAATVHDAARRWSAAYGAAGRTLDVDAPSSALAPVRSEAVATVLDVLLDNALRHGAGRVTVTLEVGEGADRIVVRDEGRCGADRSAIFDRRNADAAGTGIGLHLARTVAEAEGGRLRLRTGEPTAFELLLPLG